LTSEQVFATLRGHWIPRLSKSPVKRTLTSLNHYDTLTPKHMEGI